MRHDVLVMAKKKVQVSLHLEMTVIQSQSPVSGLCISMPFKLNSEFRKVYR
jgi:hypothetical protein